MDFKKINIGNIPTHFNSDLIIIDRRTYELIFCSLIGYSTILNDALKELKNASVNCYVRGLGSYKTSKLGYNVQTKKDMNSEYQHSIFFTKDKVNYLEDGTEEIDLFIYSTTEEDLLEKLYAKLSKHSSVPILKEWISYIKENLIIENKLSELYVYGTNTSINFKAYRLYIKKDDLTTIILNGLKEKNINIKGSNEPSRILENITGLNDYLNLVGETLANKIQNSFRPKFIPGEDEYDKFTNNIDDYIYDEANIELFEAQKSVIQAVVNNMKVNDATFLIAEMGAGKTSMGAAIPYAHNANKYKGYNCVVVCPSHLTIKWKREVEERIPNAKGYIVTDFKELKDLESKLRNKNKIENSYVILSKERAKIGYDLRPAAIWSKSKNTFVCPECGQKLYTISYEGSGRNRRKITTLFNELSMARPLAYNHKCMNKINVWDNENKKFITKDCDAKLWGPLNRDDNSHNWYKLGSEGWMLKEHIVETAEYLMSKETLNKKENQLLKKIIEPYNQLLIGEELTTTYKGPKKYPIAKYIREKMKDVFDYALIDEAHQYKGLSEQGQAVADILSVSKKSVLLTGTLLNGYADGLYYLLWRTVPKKMRKEGFSFKDEAEFARIYGVRSCERRYSLSFNGRRDRQIGGYKEKRLPGVSPLVFTKFLLDNAVFLSLSDMSDGLPGYEEIPIPVQMDDELREHYSNFENAFIEYAAPRLGQSRKNMGPFLQALTIYPDCPHLVEPLLDSNDGKTVVYAPVELEKTLRNKEEALLSLVKERLENGDKVLIYYNSVNKTDIAQNLTEMFADNDIISYEMKSSVSPEKREDWVKTHIEKGMEVMICNPSLVETGLDLLDFTSIIFYQVGYNLFTMRQASRRSWRLSQNKDVKVYFMYYDNTIQEQALSLMATKLQAAMAIEGKFSEEGLRAMSQNEDLLTQIANNVVEGIKDTVDDELFKATTFIKSNSKKGRPHLVKSSDLKLKMNSKGEKTIFSNENLEIIPERKIIDIDMDLLNNPISLFI